MSIATATSKIQYTLSGTVQALPIPFYFLQNADIKAVRSRAGVADYVMVLNTDYTLTGAGDEDGGTLTTIATNMQVGDIITIKRDIAITQTVNYVYNDRFPAETHERALDKLTMIVQQLKEVTDRAVQFPESEVVGTGNVMPSAADRAAKIFGFDASGNAVQLYDPVSAVFATGDAIYANTVAALKAVPVTDLLNGQQCHVASYSTVGDAGGGKWVYVAGSSATETVGTIVAPNSGTGRWFRVFDGVVNAKWFGAKGDGVTDDTSAINAAITFVSATQNGGVVFLPAGTYLAVGIAMKANVTLQGEGRKPYLQYPNATYATTIRQKNTGGHVITLAAAYPTRTPNIGIENLAIRGNGASVSGRGISLGAGASYGVISNVDVEFFADEGVYIGGGAMIFRDSLVSLCALNSSGLTDYKGAVFVAGSDNQVSNVEAGTNQYLGSNASAPYNAPTSVNKYCVAFHISSVNSFFRDCIGQSSDIGWVVRGPNGLGAYGTDERAYGSYNGTVFSGCRSHANAAEGWLVINTAYANRFIGCLSHSDCSGGGSDGQYSSFVEGTGADNAANDCYNTYVGCHAISQISATYAYKPKYGFYNKTTLRSKAAFTRSQYVGCWADGYLTSWFMANSVTYGDNATIWGICPTMSENTNQFGNGDTTPSVAGTSKFVTGNTNPTTITNFDDGVSGQRITVKAQDANTTIDATLIYTASQENIVMQQNEVRSFIKIGASWFEEGVPWVLKGSKTFNPADLATLTTETTTLTVTGAALGDFVLPSFSLDLGGLMLTAYVSAADTVTFVFFNPTAGNVNIGSGTLRARISRRQS